MDVRAAYARRSRRSRVAMLATVLATAIAVPAIAITSSATPRSITVYVGTASGTSAAYRANGIGGAWTRKSSSDTPDAGGSAFPTLVDLDGDGVRDMLVGNSDGRVLAFRNAGSDGAPVWQREPSWEPQVDVGSMAAPATIDLDHNGTRDLLIGNASGVVIAFKNTGTKNAPVWTRNTHWDLGDVGSAAHPATLDIDGDGRADVVIGVDGGKLLAFTGTGNATMPLARASVWDASVAATQPAPAAADLDGDGHADLLVVDSGARLAVALRNDGGHFVAQPAWLANLDAGSGPGGIAVIAGATGGGGGGSSSSTSSSTTATTVSTTPGGPVAQLTVSPPNGAAPLPVTLDASSSHATGGRQLTYAWDFGDGATQSAAPLHAAATVDAGALLTQARNDYNTADAKREGGDKVGSIAGYVSAGNTFASLTGDTGPAPFSAHGFTTINKISYFYLTKLGHDLGDVYTFNNVPGFASDCDRLQLGYLYFKDQFRVAALGGFPGLPSDPTFGGLIKLNLSTQKLHDHNCAIPPARPMWEDVSTTSGATEHHTYQHTGRYNARVTVSDGVATATATVTVVVGGDTPPPPPPPPPPPGGGSSNQPLEGFGTQTHGGAGGQVVHVSEATDEAVRDAFRWANASGAPTIVHFDVQGPITIDSPIVVTANNVTVEGNGAELDASPALGETVAPTLQFAGHDVIVRDLRLRNGGDNLRAQPTKDNPDGNYNVVFDHISSTGANDDGVSIGYGAHDVTLQYSFLAGNDRSIFIKYGATTNISLHHNWIMKQWIRGPLASQSAFVDIRNDIVEDWQLWGVRFEKEASGNVINCLFDESAYAAQRFGNANDGMNITSDQPVFMSGNAWADHAGRPWTGTASTELPAASVTTESVSAMEGNVRANAGAMPRDDTDQRYIDLPDGWSTGDRSPIRF